MIKITGRFKLALWMAALAVLMGGASFFAAAQADATSPQDMPISLKKPKPIPQNDITLPHGDGNTWTFKIVPTGAPFRWVDGPHWQHPGTGSTFDPVWGTFGPNPSDGSLSLSWISGTGSESFSVSVTGKIVPIGDGGGGGGTVTPIDISASWSGTVAGPPPANPLDVGANSNTPCPACGDEAPTPDPISQNVRPASPAFILPAAFGANIGFNMIQKIGTFSWNDNYSKTATANSDGSTTLTSPGGKTSEFDSNGNNTDPSDKRNLVTNPDGSVTVTNPDGSSETYKPTPPPSGPLMLAEMTDASGNINTLTRDANGNLTKITAADGQEMDVTRNSNGQVTSVAKAGGGPSVSYTYDANGQVASMTDASGNTTSYGYDSQGRITTFTTAAGTTSYTYEGGDGDGTTGYSAPGQPMGQAKRTTMTYPDGSKEEWFWDGYGNSWHVAPEDYVAYTTGHNNSSTDVPKTINKVETVAGKGKITQQTDPLGNTTKYQYDPNTGQLTKVTYDDDTSSSTTYNSQNNPLVVTAADGKTITFEYAANGEDVTKIKDSQGNTVATYTYDSNHNVLTSTDQDSHTTTNTYTSWGAVATVTDSNNKTTTYNYDSTSKLLTSISREGDTLASYTYDSQNRVKTQTDATGLELTYDYDAGNRLTKTTYPDSTYETITYSSEHPSQPATITDRSGRTSTLTYDSMGNVTKATDPASNNVNYAYDANGSLTQLKDAKSNATDYTYDANGQLTKKTYADSSYEQYTYNNVGQQVSSKDAKGNVTSYEYDSGGRVTKIDYANDTDVTMTYNALGQLASKTDGIGTTSYTYDNQGRVTSEDGPWTNDTITYTYDSQGRRTALGINGATQASYSYDDLDRLTGVTSGTNTFGYTYNGASGQLTQTTLPDGAKSTFTYDSLGRLTNAKSLTSNDANIANFDYTYNNRDVRTSEQKTLGSGTAQTINYTYDSTDQLTKEKSTEATPALDNSYTYDAVGNRITSATGSTSTGYTTNNLNQLTQTTIGGNNTALTYDANGNMTSEGSKTFGYNDGDQLTSVIVPGQTKSTFVYDSDGRKRISTEYTWDATANNGAGDWTQSDQTRYVYDGMNLVQERAANGDVKASYVRDGNIGGVLSMTNANGTFDYHYDGNGNVVALTDSNQNIVAQYSYDAYGNLLSSSGSEADKNPFRFSSKYYDADTGLYDYGYRQYDSSLGRWINRDPSGESSGLNLYGFVGNNPGNAVDGYGLSEDMGGGSGTVRFSFATYIPYPTAFAPYPDKHVFRGDNRGPNCDSTKYRTELNGVIDLKNHSVTFGTPGIGTTHEYTTNWTGKGTYNPSLSWSKTQAGYNIHIAGSASNPFYTIGSVDYAPPITEDVTFAFDNNGNFLHAHGDHSGFPSMELWTYRGTTGTSHLAYSFDVKALGRTNPAWLLYKQQF